MTARRAYFFDYPSVEFEADGNGYVLIGLSLASASAVFDSTLAGPGDNCRAGILQQPPYMIRSDTVQLYARPGAEVISDGQVGSRKITLQWTWTSENQTEFLSAIDALAAFIDTENGPHWLYDLRSDYMARVSVGGMRPQSVDGTADNSAQINLDLELIDSRFQTAAIFEERYQISDDPGETIFAGAAFPITLEINNDSNHEAVPVITMYSRGIPLRVIIKNNTNSQYMELQETGFALGSGLEMDMRDGSVRLLAIDGSIIDSQASMVGGGMIKLVPGKNTLTFTPDEGAALPIVQWKTERAYPF